MIRRLLSALLLVAAPVTAVAQGVPGGAYVPGARSHDQVVPPFEHLLFPPELVMQHQAALKLTPQQRTTISDAVKALQSHSIDVQWELQDEQKKLTDLLAQRPIPEGAVVTQINKLLELESTVKRAHLTALVRIKNALTPQQVEQLTQLRGRWHESNELFSLYGRTPPPGALVPPPFDWDESLWNRPDTDWLRPGAWPPPPVTPRPPM